MHEIIRECCHYLYAALKNISPHYYASFMAARDLYEKTESITVSDLAEPEIIGKLVHAAVLYKGFVVWLENRQTAKLWMDLFRILAKPARAKYA